MALVGGFLVVFVSLFIVFVAVAFFLICLNALPKLIPVKLFSSIRYFHKTHFLELARNKL